MVEEGKIEHLKPESGYGFIFADNGDSVFCHARQFVEPSEFENVARGDRVRFVRGEHRGRACATQVERVLGYALPKGASRGPGRG